MSCLQLQVPQENTPHPQENTQHLPSLLAPTAAVGTLVCAHRAPLNPPLRNCFTHKHLSYLQCNLQSPVGTSASLHLRQEFQILQEMAHTQPKTNGNRSKGEEGMAAGSGDRQAGIAVSLHCPK